MKQEEANPLSTALAALASLRLTVVLFALAIFLVFVGTLAQVDHDIWFVVEHSYFRVWVASVEWQALVRLVEMFTKAEAKPVEGVFPFPGGKLIGTLMMANLLAAHAVRFRVSASGNRLAYGGAVLLLGVAATVWTVVSGVDDAIESQLSPAFYNVLWQSLRASLAAVGVVGAYWAVKRYGQVRAAEWWFAFGVDAALLLTAAWLFANPSVRIDDAGLRILWQLAKGGAAAGVLLWGCVLLFNKRAGIVLLHAGIGLLMVGELLTDLTADEAQMRIAEGETASHTYDIRKTELALVRSEGDVDRVTVVPERILAQSANEGQKITHPDLPFDLRVSEFYINSNLERADTTEQSNPATQGAGVQNVAVPVRSVVGVGVDQGVNLPSVYFEAFDKDSGESLGVWLASMSRVELPNGGFALLPVQEIGVNGAAYRMELRFKRTYKDYSLTLNHFRFDRYIGTNTPKNYSSDVVLRDPSRGVEREVRVWMNNPLRYAGDTIYQAGFDEVTEKATILQVVTNSGWMIPYVSCMLVGLGMLAHFGVVLVRFIRRRAEDGLKPAAKEATQREPIDFKSPLFWSPALAAVLCSGYLLSKARPADDSPQGFRIARFAQTPVAEGGRIKPIDTMARNTLQLISGRQEVKGPPAASATQWLLDVISGRPEGRSHRVFRIENLELLELLGLESRPGSYRYSYDEVMRNRAELGKQIDRALERSRAEQKLSVVQSKTLELARKLEAYHKLANAFGSLDFGDPEEDTQVKLMRIMGQAESLDRSGAVRAVPPDSPDGAWMTLYRAELDAIVRQSTAGEINPATAALSGLIDAYAKQDAAEFNVRLARLEGAAAAYEQMVAGSNAESALAPAERISASKVRFETFFNQFNPFYYCAATYLIAFVLTAASWLFWPRSLSRAATAVIVVTLLVHTFALVARIYISGRPPVTNLYSSAVFIGWGAVLFGVLFEAIYRIGVGNAVASVVGFSTLVVAYFLSLDGDTFTVLQAVLDTQFWLATHVVCITLGYSTTYLAGFLGIAHILAGHLMGKLDVQAERQLSRMTYGTLCFAIFFSFIGTVLGGLWADDSWGRFWGWDPKENGALIIVLWNALVLHARWGKLVSPVGLATLVVGGNIVTSWSWFGVNELGVGLHAYGANDSPTAMVLLGFVASQLVVIALGCLPVRRAVVQEQAKG